MIQAEALKLDPQVIRKIGVFRALQLGDLLCSVPAFRALRAAYPAAEITLIGLPWAASFVDRFSRYFDAFTVFPGYPGLPEQAVDPEETVAFIERMQREEYDLVIQMHGNGTIVNSMIDLLESKHTAGFFLPGDYSPNQELFLEYPSGIHETERHLRLMQHLGIPATDNQLEFPVTAADEETFRQLNLPIEPGKYMCVHPGSRGSWRQWPPAYFAALADHCACRGFSIVLTGTAGEADIAKQVEERMTCPAINLTGKTDLGALSVLIRDAYALICNCTGVSHMASALQTRSVVISMDGEPERWGPTETRLHHTIDWTKTPYLSEVMKYTASLFTSI